MDQRNIKVGFSGRRTQSENLLKGDQRLVQPLFLIEENTESLIEGDAVEFCQVVTQTRNIADTGLKATGEAAAKWMAIAQCFAGPPEEPPAPGARG